MWTKDMAKNDQEAVLFRELSDKEEDEFRECARKKFENNPDINIDNPLWHPVVRQELKALKGGF